MAHTGIAEIFMQAAASRAPPLAFHLPGDPVRLRRIVGGILLEPMAANLDTWFAQLDRFADLPLMEKGRQQQPPMLEVEDLFA